MNLGLNVFSSSNETRYTAGALIGGGFSITAFSTGFDIGVASGDTGAFETEGTFDDNTFSSTSTTRYEVAEAEGIFDDSFDFTFN